MTLQEKTLFRGKRVIDGEWVTGNYVNCYRPGMNTVTGHFIVEYPGEYYDEIYTSTVGRYTGLKDKYGQRIFEGDIVDYNGTPHQVVFEDRFGCAYFGIRMSGIETWDFCPAVPSNLMRIIGNIHDNPELMEVQNENG